MIETVIPIFHDATMFVLFIVYHSVLLVLIPFPTPHYLIDLCPLLHVESIRLDIKSARLKGNRA